MATDLSRLRELLETIRQQATTFPFSGRRFRRLEFVSGSKREFFQVRDEDRSQLWAWEGTFDTIVEALESVAIWFERLNRPAHAELLRAGRERLKQLYWNTLGTYPAETWADIKANKLPDGVKNNEMPGQELWGVAIGDNAEPVVRFNWLGEFDSSHLSEHIGQLRRYARLLLNSIEGSELSTNLAHSDGDLTRRLTAEFWAVHASNLRGGILVDVEFSRKLAEQYGNRGESAADLLTIDEIAKLVKAERQTVYNKFSDNRKTQNAPSAAIVARGSRPAHYSYAAIRPWLLQTWPESASRLSKDFADVKALLA